MKLYPNIRKILANAFQTNNEEKINGAILAVVDGVAKQCHNEYHDQTYDHTDIDDLDLYTYGQHPKDFAEAYNMLNHGSLVLADKWKISVVPKFIGKQRTDSYVFFEDGQPDDHGGYATFADLVLEEKVDALLRGWSFQK